MLAAPRVYQEGEEDAALYLRAALKRLSFRFKFLEFARKRDNTARSPEP